VDFASQEQSTNIAQKQNRDIEILVRELERSSISHDDRFFAIHAKMLKLRRFLLAFISMSTSA